MSSAQELWTHVSQWATGIGVPSALAYFGRRIFLKTRAERRKDNAAAELEESTLDSKIRTSSVTAVEAQMVAMERGFNAERAALVGTVEHQRTQLIEERAYSASRDAIITELRSEIEELRARLAEVAHKLEGL